ncbi:DUF72 domain-containing protein [Hymenobacter sp. B1770]|uniref:DUF72 domain-containing protein n=1 Tax=Hymenobacter sp. B1770 TaxID=1718788 RepID=UPI003CF4B8EE
MFQLPPKAAYTEELMERLLNSLDPNFNNVAEFRHPSWWDGQVQRTLARIAAEVQTAKNVKEVYLHFNNGIAAVGVENARQMQQLLQAQP